MRPLSELTPTQIFDRVRGIGACHNNPEVDKHLFMPAPKKETPVELQARLKLASELCGRCSVRGACEEYARRRCHTATAYSVHGGLFIGNRVILNIATGATMPQIDFFQNGKKF